MGTVDWGCQFIWFLDLFTSVFYSKSCPFVSDIGNSYCFKYQISEPSSRGLLASGETCLYSFLTYLQGTVCLGATCLYDLQTYLQGIVCQGCRLFPNLLSASDAACLYSFQSYLQGNVSPGCGLFISQALEGKSSNRFGWKFLPI